MSEITILTEQLQKQIAKKLVFGVGLNDSEVPTSVKVFDKYVVCPYYKTWCKMLERCYSSNYQLKQPTYIGCSVAKDWLTFSNFKDWMKEQDWVGKQLDKDLLVQGNKLYSPETCIFVSKRVNVLLTDSGARRGNCKLGVSYRKDCNKFQAVCSNGIKQVPLGLFKSEDEAHLAYLNFKKLVIINCANEQTDLRLKQALFNIANSYTL